MTAPPAGALEACPFCGGEAAIDGDGILEYRGRQHTDVFIGCLNCGAQGPTAPDANPDEPGYADPAIAAWNRRPALLAALRLREGCEARIRAWRAGGPGLIDQQHVIYDYCADDLARVLEEGE